MNTNLFLLRHFERIDDSGANDKEIEKKWNQIDSKNPIFLHNPYLSDKALNQVNIEKVIKQISNIKSIDIIVSSPFLRCIQTSLIMMDKINQIKITDGLEPIPYIYIDFGLCEFIDDFNFYDITLPYNLMEIYNNSLEYLNQKQINIEIFKIFNFQPNIINEYETDDTYFQRVKQTIKKIQECFMEKNVLIVSHAYSYMIIDENKTLKYYEPIKIEPCILSLSSLSSSSSSNEFKSKYLKYKQKYFELKKKM
jgi:broad specificity phosphatase PhoE